MADLQRPDPKRNERKAFLIATEDEKSARSYFESLKDHLKAHRVLVIADHTGSAPNSVVQTAKDTKDARDRDVAKGLEDPFGEVWVVFDTEGPQNDQRRKEAMNAIDRAKQLGFHTAISNPCFEFWILLHFEWCVSTFVDGESVCKRLRKKKFIADYEKSKDVFSQTWDRVETAIEHAKRIFRERCQGRLAHPCKCHPCTQVYCLIETILKDY